MSHDDLLAAFGPAGPLRDVWGQIARTASTRLGLLISGEPGTGRGSVARMVHAYGDRREGPFIEVSCAAIDRDAVESHLFGTPVPPANEGVAHPAFELVAPGSILHQAMGGTLYFRNVDELPARVQLRLARLFRDRECLVQPEGAPVPCDVRPMVSGDPGFATLVSEGRLRADLYRRCSEAEVHIPPLRDRRADVPAIAAFLLEQSCRRVGLPGKTIEAAAEAVLAAMPWRGNHRELQRLLETLAVRVTSGTISLHDLLDVVRLDGNVTAPWNLEGTLREARRRFEREYIAAVIAQHQGRVPDAARSLGIQRTNLYRKLRTLHVKPAQIRKPDRSGTMGS